jgi:hypothetical protein
MKNVTLEKEIEGPVNRHSQFALKAGKFHQVDRPKEPLGDEAGKLKTVNLCHSTAPPQAGEIAEGLELKRHWFSAIKDGGNILSEPLSLSYRILRSGRTKTACDHIGNRRAVSHGPQASMSNHGHCGIHCEVEHCL